MGENPEKRLCQSEVVVGCVPSSNSSSIFSFSKLSLRFPTFAPLASEAAFVDQYFLGTAVFKPRSRRLCGFLLCLRFLNRAAVGWTV